MVLKCAPGMVIFAYQPHWAMKTARLVLQTTTESLQRFLEYITELIKKIVLLSVPRVHQVLKGTR